MNRTIAVICFIALLGTIQARSDETPPDRFGLPPATYLTIEGTRMAKGSGAERVLLVEKVNGLTLDAPFRVLISNVPPLPANTRYILSGKMLGTPPEPGGNQNVAVLQAAWQVPCYFIVTSVEDQGSIRRTPIGKDGRPTIGNLTRR